MLLAQPSPETETKRPVAAYASRMTIDQAVPLIAAAAFVLCVLALAADNASQPSRQPRPRLHANLSPEILKAVRRKLRVAHCMLDVTVAEISLQSPRIVSLVGEGKAAGVPQHVRVSLKSKPGGLASALYHAGKASRGERRAALRREHKGGLRILHPSQAAQRPQLITADRVRAG